jgi:hypothetical protein
LPAKAEAAPEGKAGAVAPKHVYTVLAREGINAAQLINARLAKKTIGKADPRRVEVASPHGPSTSGGKKARQSITLVPVSGEGGSIMFGWLDVGQKLAELRTHEDVARQYKKRFGGRFDVTAEEYGVLVKDLEQMLGMLQFSMIEEEEEEAESAAPAGPKNGGKTLVYVAVAAALVIAIIALVH